MYIYWQIALLANCDYREMKYFQSWALMLYTINVPDGLAGQKAGVPRDGQLPHDVGEHRHQADG